jgi:xanthine dehydrogenase accessory factor
MFARQAVLETAEYTIARGEDCVLATVVKVNGSVYRRPGARLLATRDGRWIGSISGGCLEKDLVRKAWWLTEQGPQVVIYDSSADDEIAWQFGLGCNGVVHALLERISRDQFNSLDFLRRIDREQRCGVLVSVLSAEEETGLRVGEHLAIDNSGFCEGSLNKHPAAALFREAAEDCLATGLSGSQHVETLSGEAELFSEYVPRPSQLIVCGAGFDAVPVVRAAKTVGWNVTVAVQRNESIRRAAFRTPDQVLVGHPSEVISPMHLGGNSAAVVMNHNYPEDRAAIEALLASSVGYIGILGPRARTDQILKDIGAAEDDRIHAPVGLDIGAETPEEIALAIVGEIVAHFAGHGGGLLRDRPGPIHDRPPIFAQELVG